jgi:hypothetical protein
MWLPQWLYEGLPAIYIAAGAAALAMFGHASPAIVSAFLLFLAAVMVANWRRVSRRAVALVEREQASRTARPRRSRSAPR